jgi:hypothetical protein
MTRKELLEKFERRYLAPLRKFLALELDGEWYEGMLPESNALLDEMEQLDDERRIALMHYDEHMQRLEARGVIH